MIKMKRLIAIYIDFIVIIMTTLLTNIIMFGHFNQSETVIVIIIGIIVYLFVFYTLMIRKDLLFKNASLGKKIFKLNIIMENGEIPKQKIILKRNIETFSSFPTNILSIIFDNTTSGDRKYNTSVCLKK